MRTTRMQQKSQPKISSIKNTMKFEFDDETKTANSKITIKDLCPEDKAKIGDLIKKLAEEQEQKQKLLSQIQSQEEKYKKTVKKYQKLSESAKKEQKETENKFKESLDIIKKLQQQESLIQEQMFHNQVTKFDSFTQCELEILDTNKENKQSQNLSDEQVEKPKPQSEILLLKAEIEQITNSLKQLQFGANINSEQNQEFDIQPNKQQLNTKPQAPLPKPQIIKNQQDQEQNQMLNRNDKFQDKFQKQTQFTSATAQTQQTIIDPSGNKQKTHEIAVLAQKKQNSAHKEIQTDEIQQTVRQSNQSIKVEKQQKQKKQKFYEQFLQLENKLQQNKSNYIGTNSIQNISFQNSNLSQHNSKESSSDYELDDEDEFIADQLMKLQSDRLKSSLNETPQMKDRTPIQSQSLQKLQQQVQQQYQIDNELIEQQVDINKKLTFPQHTQVQQSNNFKTNTLSFNLTNEYTPQHSNTITNHNSSNLKYKSDSQQFNPSILQTPQQQSLYKEVSHEDPDDIDSIISSLNGRTFTKQNNQSASQSQQSQQLQFQFDDQSQNYQQQQSQQLSKQLENRVEEDDELNSSASSIPKEEYLRLIAKYSKKQLENSNN